MTIVRVQRGLPGSGKSFRASQAAEEARSKGLSATIVSADHYFTQPDGSYEFRPNKLTEAHRQCFTRFLDALEQKQDLVVIDNTNIRLEEFELYLKVARIAGCTIQVDAVKPKDDAEIVVWHRRCQHGVPLEKMRQRWTQWEEYDDVT